MTFTSKMAPVTVTPIESGTPNITSTAISTSVDGSAYNYSPTATGASPIMWELDVAPVGMVIDGVSGNILWVLVSLGSHLITIRATNSEGQDEQSFDLLITEQPPKIVIAPEVNGVEGEEYTNVPLARGTMPVTWELIQGPGGMEINSDTGKITLEFPVEGASSVVFSATNAGGVDWQTYTLIISSKSGIVSVLTDTGDDGVAYRKVLDAVGTVPRVWSLTGEPSGMVINGHTGVIDWPTPVIGSHIFTIAISNVAGFDTFSFSLDIT